MYSYSFFVDNNEHKQSKRVNKNVFTTISHNEYEDVLLNKKCVRHSSNKIQSNDFFYLLFINLKMSTEWSFTFLNTAIIVFCLIYFLDIAYSNQNPSFFFLWKSHYHSLLYIFCTPNALWGRHTKKNLTFLFSWLRLVWP